jgi:hypothetical protein
LLLTVNSVVLAKGPSDFLSSAQMKVRLLSILTLTLVSLSAGAGWAQPNLDAPVGPPSLDHKTSDGGQQHTPGKAEYVKSFPGTIRLVFALPALDIRLDTEAIKKNYEIQSNASLDVGIDGSYNGFGLGISYRTEPDDESIKVRGKTTYEDYQIYYYGERFGASVFYQDYTGFYVDPTGSDDACEGPEGCLRLPDLSMTNYGANLYYVFSPGFSLAAAFKQTARQRVSAGSWLVMVVADRLTLTKPSPIPPMEWADDLGDVAGLTDATFSSLGLAGGYGYTFAGKRWSASPMVLVGGSLQHQRYRDSGGEHSGYRGAINVTVKLAAGYHGDRHLAGVVALLHSQTSQIEELQLQWFGGTVEFYYGIHF